MKENTCPFCKKKLRLLVTNPSSAYKDDIESSLYQCIECKTAFTSPKPTEDRLNKIYENNYSYLVHKTIELEKKRNAKQLLNIIEVKPKSRLLDVGCMWGDLIEEAKHRGINVHGVELSPGPTEIARSKGLSIFQGEITEFLETKPKQFNTIVMQHVLEHILEPDTFLQAAHSLLSPEGKICICVPNIECITRKIFPKAWGWYQTPIHITHFSQRGLTLLLERNGFQITKKTKRGGDSIYVAMTICNLFNIKTNNSKTTSKFKETLLKLNSLLLRNYKKIGDEELIIIATKQ